MYGPHFLCSFICGWTFAWLLPLSCCYFSLNPACVRHCERLWDQKWMWPRPDPQGCHSQCSHEESKWTVSIVTKNSSGGGEPRHQTKLWEKTWISQTRMMASGGFGRQGLLIWGKTVFLTELQKVRMWGVVRNVAGSVNHSWKNRSNVSWALLKNVEVFLGATGDC